MIRALVRKTSTCLVVTSMIFAAQSQAQADVFDSFDSVSPVNAWIDDCTSSLNWASTCETCEQACDCCCNCPPAPTMIGDSLGIPFVINDAIGVHLYPNFYSKVADNNSAIPQSRFFVTYQYFNDVDTYKGAVDEARDLSLYTIGMEKSFADGLMSVDLFLPVSYSPNTDFSGADALQTPQEQLELQNIAFGLKILLAQTPTSAYSAGVRFEAPTANPLRDLGNAYQLTNDAWAVTPYLAALYTPSEKVFIQAFAAYRMQTTDETEEFFVAPPNNPAREPAYLNLDAQLGYWLYRSGTGEGLTGLQAKAELHYTGTNSPFQPNPPLGSLFSSAVGEVDALNATAGLTALFSDTSTLTVAAVMPLRSGSNLQGAGVAPFPTDRTYDWEFILQYNHYFGN